MNSKVMLAGVLTIALGTVPVATADDAAQRSGNLDAMYALIDGITNGTLTESEVRALVAPSTNQYPYSVWAQYQRSSVKDDRGVLGKEADSDTYATGIDYRLNSRTVLGIGILHQDVDMESDVSPAPLGGYTDVDNDGNGLMLYGSYVLNNGLLVDGSFSYVRTNVSITDGSAFADPTQKSTDSTDYALAVGISAPVLPVAERIWLDARASFTHAWGEQDSFYDVFDRRHDGQDYQVGTLGVTSNLNYRVNEWFIPYAGVNVGYDLYSDAADPDDVLNPGGWSATEVPNQGERDEFSYGYQVGVYSPLSDTFSVAASFADTRWGSELKVRSLAVTGRLLF